MQGANFLAFAIATLSLNLTPGNNMFLIISRSLGYGIKVGIVTVYGITCGCLCHTIITCLGLSKLASSSSAVMTTIEVLGGLYLIYLGVRSFTNSKELTLSVSKHQRLSYKKTFLDGVISNLLNAQLILFFISFLPQFVQYSDSTPVFWQLTFLGLWYAFSSFVTNCLIAWFFGKVGDIHKSQTRFFRIIRLVSGSIFLLLGIKLIFLKTLNIF